MIGKQTIEELLHRLKNDQNTAHWQTIPGREAHTAPFPDSLDEHLKDALRRRGINSLYTHQAEAYNSAMMGSDLVLVTPTASGKTLCYNLPVLQTMIAHPESRALYFFPTKALAQDQKNEMADLIDAVGLPIKSHTYDGDTAGSIRQKIRQAGQIVMTNPDMLHASILPHHTKWVSLFENLRFVVIDELHTYRGVFGSHVANVIRRLKRICRYYGSNPQFICTSATIANPREHAEALTGRKMFLIDRNGAPSVKKHFLIYNPPVTNKQLNVREDETHSVVRLAGDFLKNKIQTIVFAKSRLKVELLVSHLQKINSGRQDRAPIRAYRGGYLPLERRAIEKGLRQGEIMGVVTTNALELGVDIGQLQVCILTGYPGNMASVWQQAGRAGRRSEDAVIIMVTSSNPLDQYMANHTDYFFSRKPESVRINPDNIMILMEHIKCAAYELPFKKGERFGSEHVDELCDYLTDEDLLHYQRGKWYWMSDGFPANNVNLRSAAQDSFAIIDITDQGHAKVIGEEDRFGAMTMLYEDAIYIHQGAQYHVDDLDLIERKAYVRKVNVNYYTDSDLAVQLDVLAMDKHSVFDNAHIEKGYGDVSVRALPTIFKKIRFETYENIGWGKIHLPELEMHTNAAWISFDPIYLDQFGKNVFQGALVGLSHLLRHAAPLFVLCDQNDLSVVPKIKAPHNEKPSVFIYDKYPGGVGLSENLYQLMPRLLEKASDMAQNCPCESGCPSCIGFVNEGRAAKQALIRLLKERSTCHSHKN